MSHFHPHAYFHTQSLLWLATYWPSRIGWTSEFGTNPNPASLLANELVYPGTFEKALSVYRPSKGNQALYPSCVAPILKKGSFCAVIDAHVPTFTLQTLKKAWDTHTVNLQTANPISRHSSLSQVHEMTERSLQYGVKWVDIQDVLQVTIPRIVSAILATLPPLFPPSLLPTAQAPTVYVYYTTNKYSASTSFFLRISYLNFPLVISPAPANSPTELGTINLLLPSDTSPTPHLWPTIQSLLTTLQTELQRLGVHLTLPF